MAEQAALAANVSQLSRSLGLVTEMYQFTMNYQETKMFQLTNMPKLRLGAVSWSVPSSNLPGNQNVYGTAGLFPESHLDNSPCEKVCRIDSCNSAEQNFMEFLLLIIVFQFVGTNNSWPKSKKYSQRESQPIHFRNSAEQNVIELLSAHNFLSVIE